MMEDGVPDDLLLRYIPETPSQLLKPYKMGLHFAFIPWVV